MIYMDKVHYFSNFNGKKCIKQPVEEGLMTVLEFESRVKTAS